LFFKKALLGSAWIQEGRRGKSQRGAKGGKRRKGGGASRGGINCHGRESFSVGGAPSPEKKKTTVAAEKRSPLVKTWRRKTVEKKRRETGERGLRNHLRGLTKIKGHCGKRGHFKLRGDAYGKNDLGGGAIVLEGRSNSFKGSKELQGETHPRSRTLPGGSRKAECE